MPVATAALLVTLEAIAAPAMPAPAVAPSLYSELQPDSSAAGQQRSRGGGGHGQHDARRHGPARQFDTEVHPWVRVLSG